MTAISRIAVVVTVLFFVSGVHAGDDAFDGAFNIGMVPEAGSTQASMQEKLPLKLYLTRTLGRDVNLVIPASYDKTIEALGNGTLDFALLGGFAYLKAHKQYDVIPLVQRSADLQFHALFITSANSTIRSLGDLKGKKFAFGDVTSASGHLIPYLEMRQAGINPDNDLQFKYTGSHLATAKAVESGLAEAGALDETMYNSLIADGKLDKTKVRVFYSSKPFVDYVWVARKDVSPADRERFIEAYTSLKEGHDNQILQILRGKEFVRANNEEYAVLRLVAQQLKML